MALSSNNISVNCAQSSNVGIIKPSYNHISANKNDNRIFRKDQNSKKDGKNDGKHNKNIKRSKISSSTNE